MKRSPDILALIFRGIATGKTNMIAQDYAVANPAPQLVSFNVASGGGLVGPGCDHCYAEALMAGRYGRVD